MKTQLNDPTYNEVKNIIIKLKSHRSPGPDNVPEELLKNGGALFKSRIFKLILTVWKKEEMPKDWSEGIICPILKKGDRTLCNNYRGITLLDVTYKVFAILLYNILLEIVEKQLGDFQMGFWPGRSTIDNIHIVFEKCYKYNINLHNLFIDFSQAFDAVNRDKLFEYLEYYQTPPKLIKVNKNNFAKYNSKG
jgi:hypothetical protein